MAEQFPEEGGKIPWLGFQDARQTWAPRPLPGLGSGEMQSSTAPPPATPDRTGVSLGFFASPLPKPRRTFPWYPYSHQSVLSFPSGTPASLLNVPAAHHPLEAPLPCCCTRFPLAPWHPLNSQLAPPMSLCFPVPTTLAESCPGSLFWGPLALASGKHWCWGPGGASEGTAGAAAPRSATHVVLGLLGVGGRSLWGHCKAGARHQAWQCPDCGGPGSELLPLKPAPPVWGDPGWEESVRLRRTAAPGWGSETAPGAAAVLSAGSGRPSPRGAALTWAGRLRVPVHGPLVAGSLRALQSRPWPRVAPPPLQGMGPGDPRGRVRGRGPRGLHRAAEPGSGDRPPALPPARPPSTLQPPPSRAEPPPSGLCAACARRSVCECVRGRVYVCVSSCVSAPGAPPAPPARCRAPLPPPAARCRPRAALQPAPAAAPRAPPPPPRAPPAAPAGRARSPPAGLFGPAGPAAPIDPPHRCAPDGSGFEPRRAAEPATSSEVPFDSVPKSVEIHSGFSAR